MKTEPYTAAEVDAMRFEARRDAIYYVIMTAAAFGFFGLGLFFEGYLHDFSMIASGLYLGHIITEALNKG
jgi:hypothetical protein